MKTGRLLLIGLLLFLPTTVVRASLFDVYFDGAEKQMPWSVPSEKIANFAMKEMETWNENGILLFPGDIEAAVLGDKIVLCNDKFDMNGQKITFSLGSAGELNGCDQLQRDIMSVVKSELKFEELGSDLLAIANGSELAIADQPHRPAQVGVPVLLATRLWSGTGTRIIPWPGGKDTPLEQKFQELDQALQDAKDLDETVWRFQHGYFRDQREADPKMQDYGKDVQGILGKIAEMMKISGKPKERGEFATPELATPNVGFWARADDVGLMWIAPDHLMRIGDIERGGKYPLYIKNGTGLAYPFFYGGSNKPDPSIASPLCSRSAGMQGFLCRPKPSATGLCDQPTTGTGISLVTCKPAFRLSEKPEMCPALDNILFENQGQPLTDPNDPRLINPNLKEAQTGSICTPEYKVLYKDEIPAHACYVAHCLEQSMNGHTLVTNRSPAAVGEATSSFLGCIRPDPQLGLYAELARTPSIPLPTYLGLNIVADLERGYCAKVGYIPRAISSYCTYLSNRRSNSPQLTLAATTASTAEEFANVNADLSDFITNATIIGQRTVLDQAYPVYRKLVESLANDIHETATLLNELELAKPTVAICPWTGTFPRGVACGASAPLCNGKCPKGTMCTKISETVCECH